MCQVLTHCGFSGVSPDGNCATSIEVIFRPTLVQSDEPSDLRGLPSPKSVYSTWQSQAVNHPIMNRARRCLTSVIEPTPMSERRIPYYIGDCKACTLFCKKELQGGHFEYAN